MFDITILPIHLVQGRNLGDLPGLKAHTAPRRAERSRKDDLLVVLISIEYGKVAADMLDDWNDLIAERYFKARGSITMGFTTATKSLQEHLAKQFDGKPAPNVFLNLCVIRGRTLMASHSGPVTTTVICSDRVENYNDLSSDGVAAGISGMRFYQSELHSGDIVLMCPFVPYGWSNQAILDATIDSPLNVIRYLLDLSKGNICGVVIQVKNGRGEINYRFKAPLIANVEAHPVATDEKMFEPSRQDLIDIEERIQARPAQAVSERTVPAAKVEKPLYRLRVPADPFPYRLPSVPERENIAVSPVSAVAPVKDAAAERQALLDEMGKVTIPEFTVGEPESGTDVSEFDLHGADHEDKMSEPVFDSRERIESVHERRRQRRAVQRDKPAKTVRPKRRGGFGRILFIVLLAVLVPILVVTVVIGLYTTRGNRATYRVNLKGAVETAKIAAAQTDPTLAATSWEKVLEYLDEARRYGSSAAEKELRAQANESLDQLDRGVPMRYYYGLASILPAGTNLTKLEAVGAKLFALDATTGSILRFSHQDNGFSLDADFSCKPGTYASYSEPKDLGEIAVGKLVDFVVLPIESGMDRLVVGVDRDANILYCSRTVKGAADSIQPVSGTLYEVVASQFENRRLYLLDSSGNAIQSVPYLGKAGVGLNAETYFGTQGPPLYDVIDFKIVNTDVFLLRENGGLIVCDYKGYLPICSFVDSVSSSDGSMTLPIVDRDLIEIGVNTMPDRSLYLFDRERLALVNVTLKLNLVRYLVPDRFAGDVDAVAGSAFTFFDRGTVVWAAADRLYVGTLP